MTWRERTVLRVLMIVVRIIGRELPAEILKEIGDLDIHIRVWRGEEV